MDNVTEVNVMYSNFALHGAPISLNIAMNALLKKIAGENYKISTTNKPLEHLNQHYNRQFSATTISILWLFIFPLGKIF